MNASQKSGKGRKMPVFYRVYFTVLIVFFALLIIALFVLNRFIKDYNERLPETVSQRVFNEYFTSGDTEKLIAAAGYSVGSFESDAAVRQYVGSLFDPSALTYTSVSAGLDGSDGTKAYIVKSGDYKIASFTLKESGKSYELDTLALHLPGGTSRTYEILSGSKLYINGIEVSDAYITNAHGDGLTRAYSLLGDIEGAYSVVYTVPGILSEPVVDVIDRFGNTTTVDENGREKVVGAHLPDFEQFILEAAKQYAKCMQADAGKNSVLKYYETGTDLYYSIQTAENYFVWDHDCYAFEDEKVSETTDYGDVVSARVSFTHILKMYGQNDYRDHIDITFFAHRHGDSYLIFAQQING